MKIEGINGINTFWEKIVNTINDGLMFIGPDGSILTVNRAFETLTGYSAEEAVGRSCKMLECDACERTLKTGEGSVWCRLFEKGRGDLKKCRCQVKCKGGAFIPVLKNASVLRDENGTVLGVVETLTDISELASLDEKVRQLYRQYDQDNGFFGLIGKSGAMERVFEMIAKVAESNAPVIIRGESGAGKELVANAIHMLGSRKHGPFIRLNCAALNESVLESELFGHVKGAFTGARHHRIGRFEAANGGDFFLDEIGDIPAPLQTKLLRVLESGRFERVGDLSPVEVDVRIITATNKNLEEMIEKKEFRQDLFFRINVIPIHLPPLRERKEDIPLLINTFINRLNRRTGKSMRGLSRDAMALFINHRWPGNIREMKNAMEYAYVTAGGPIIRPDHLPPNIPAPGSHAAPISPGPNDAPSTEKARLIEALKATGGNQTRAARLLNINRVTVWNRMRKYGIDIKKVMST